jgi:hypothetical protein
VTEIEENIRITSAYGGADERPIERHESV